MASEFIALASASKEAEYLRDLIYEIPIWPKPVAPISIHYDSEATLLELIVMYIMEVKTYWT